MSSEINQSMKEEIRVSRWGVGVACTILLFVIAQTGAVVIWGARLTERVSAMSRELSDIKQSLAIGTQYRYTSEDARADRQSMMILLDAINQRISLSEQRIRTLEEFYLRQAQPHAGS